MSLGHIKAVVCLYNDLEVFKAVVLVIACKLHLELARLVIFHAIPVCACTDCVYMYKGGNCVPQRS